MSDPDLPGITVRIERTLRAPPERVFQAFLEPDLIRRWMVPDDLAIERISVEAKVGGRIEIWHSRGGVNTGRFEGSFLRIDPPRELVYRWAFVGTEPERGEYFDTLVTVRLRPEPGDRTRISVVHERLGELRRGAPHVHAELVPGWSRCLQKLDLAVA